MHILSQFSALQWLLIICGACIIGITKAGLKGVDMLSVTLMALVFGGKSSTGIVLPLLCVADIAAVTYYHRHAQWAHFRKLIPWMAAGIIAGVFAGRDMPEQVFRRVMAGIVLVTIGIVLWMEWRKSKEVPRHPLFAAGTGLAAGFTTMMGNLAGAFSNLYFLAMRLPKNDFIGTAAWIFFVINLFKLPFQVFVWKNITAESLLTDLILLPALAVGFVLGIVLVRRLHDNSYRKVVIVLTLIGSVFMLLR